MGGRRTDNPFTILILGMFMIAGFGACLVFLNKKSPILQLRPLLKKNFRFDKTSARFRAGRPGSPAAVVIAVHPEEDLGTARDHELAEWALRNYLDLAMKSEAGTTTVTQVEIHVEGTKEPRFVLHLALVQSFDTATNDLPALTARLKGMGLRSVHLEVSGYSTTGVKLSGQVSGGRSRATRLRVGREAMALLSSLRYAGEVQLDLLGSPPLRIRGGRDVPRLQRGIAPLTTKS
jgi:hypothetical protein